MSLHAPAVAVNAAADNNAARANRDLLICTPSPRPTTDVVRQHTRPHHFGILRLRLYRACGSCAAPICSEAANPNRNVRSPATHRHPNGYRSLALWRIPDGFAEDCDALRVPSLRNAPRTHTMVAVMSTNDHGFPSLARKNHKRCPDSPMPTAPLTLGLPRLGSTLATGSLASAGWTISDRHV